MFEKRQLTYVLLALVASCTSESPKDLSESLASVPIHARDWESAVPVGITDGFFDLPTTDFAWVPIDEQPEAIELFRSSSWRALSEDEAGRIGAAQLFDPSNPDLVPFLVRGNEALVAPKDQSLVRGDRLRLFLEGTQLRVERWASRYFDSYQAAPRAVLVLLPRAPTDVLSNALTVFYGGMTVK